MLSVWELLPASSRTHPMENLRSLLWVSLGSSAEGRVFGALGANRLCWECSAVDLERGAAHRDVLCLELRCVCTCSKAAEAAPALSLLGP